MSTPIVSPTSKCFVFAVFASIAISCGALRPAAGGQDERVEPLVALRVDAEREARRAACARDAPCCSRPTSFASSEMPPSATATPGSPRTFCEQRLGQRRRRDALVRVAADRALAGDHGVGVLVDLGEDGAERGLDRVGEDVGAADHRDAEHDRDRRQQRRGACGRASPLSATPITSRGRLMTSSTCGCGRALAAPARSGRRR